jgi:hypothetical protein
VGGLVCRDLGHLKWGARPSCGRALILSTRPLATPTRPALPLPDPLLPSSPIPPCPAPSARAQTLSGSQAIIVATPFGTMLLVILSTFLVHTIYLVFNTLVVALLRLPMPEAACVVIMASQKVGFLAGGAAAARAEQKSRSRAPPRPAGGARPPAAAGTEDSRPAPPTSRPPPPPPTPNPPTPTPQSAPVAVTVITYIASDTQTQGLLAVPCVVGQLVQIFVGQPLAHYLADRIVRWRRANPQGADALVKAAGGRGGSGAAAAAADGAVLVGGGDVESAAGGAAAKA